MNSLVQHILGTARFVSGTRNQWQEIHYRQGIFSLKKSCQVKSGFYIAVCKTRCLHTCKAATFFFFFSLLMKVTFRNVGGNSSLALKAEWEQNRPSSHASLQAFLPSSPYKVPCPWEGKPPDKPRDVQCAPSAARSTPALPVLWQREGAACCLQPPSRQSLHLSPGPWQKPLFVTRLMIKIL